MARVPLLGGAYQMRSLIAGAQRSVNLFSENNPGEAQSPVPVTTYPTPGLRFLGRPSDQPGTPDPIPVPPVTASATHFAAPGIGVTSGLARTLASDTAGLPLVGAVDSPFLSGSIWVQLDSIDANGAAFLETYSFAVGSSVAAVEIYTSAGDWGLSVWPATGGGFVDSFTIEFLDPGQAFPIGVPVNIQFAVDTNHGAGSKVYVVYMDDVLMTPSDIEDIASAFDIGFSTIDHTFIGTSSPGTGPNGALVGSATEWWIAPGQYIDFTNSANRLKFRTAGGKAVAIGGDGSSVTGTAPILYFAGNAAEFAVNAGTGGAFTNAGGLSDSGVNFY